MLRLDWCCYCFRCYTGTFRCRRKQQQQQRQNSIKSNNNNNKNNNNNNDRDSNNKASACLRYGVSSRGPDLGACVRGSARSKIQEIRSRRPMVCSRDSTRNDSIRELPKRDSEGIWRNTCTRFASNRGNA